MAATPPRPSPYELNVIEPPLFVVLPGLIDVKRRELQRNYFTAWSDQFTQIQSDKAGTGTGIQTVPPSPDTQPGEEITGQRPPDGMLEVQSVQLYIVYTQQIFFLVHILLYNVTGDFAIPAQGIPMGRLFVHLQGICYLPSNSIHQSSRSIYATRSSGPSSLHRRQLCRQCRRQVSHRSV